MTRRWIAACLAILLLAACGAPDGSDGRRQIVVTTTILGDVVSQVVGDTADVRVMMKPNADPHSYGLSAADAAEMAKADLVVYNGLGLEESMQRHVDAAAENGVPTLPVGDHVDPLQFSEDEHGGADPHFWTDPQRMILAVDAIAGRVAELPGIDQAAVAANAASYRDELNNLSAHMTDRFAAIPAEQRKLVTNHHVLGYLADRFGFTVIGAVIPSGTTLASPSASDLESLAGAIRDAGVKAIFVDSSQPDRLAHVLAEQSGVRVNVVSLYSESLSAPGTEADSYLGMMRTNTETIANNLI
ncbi:zinc ABC transporter substrate-binding protein AztC [Mycolicibacterium goodii]|uniref:Metal ABC transporter substrate-binding protein n=1 Tax=Mycolicibacterium goodii TaxID=134601 RepID=A0ABS6HZ21_MYCGD|nr:zinc ABC transporter substrate-binding protein AztC [Mycolicibacterium goodii]MBU8826760.1 metal ABC transporter substrate-binding protein [Mycolicibacterium goodii]MBU8837709.1 metal ABC transporter substrate-binding protein [Mycolicibacterium goodii]